MWMRRKNSSSDDNPACGTRSFSIFPKMNSSMRFLRGTAATEALEIEGRSRSVSVGKRPSDRRSEQQDGQPALGVLAQQPPRPTR